MFKRILVNIGKRSGSNIYPMRTQMLSSSVNPNSQIEEVEIKVPWGHISAKWWGPKQVRPMLCIHGWQDNAGSFDSLIPLLLPNIGYLAIDLPGNGFSSRFPDGMVYNHYDSVIVFKAIKKYFGWPTLSILSHSVGSLQTFWYTSIFPNDVDMFIGIDMLKPKIKDPARFVKTIADVIEKNLIADERNRLKTEPPSYTMDELRQMLHAGSVTPNSVSIEAADHLLKRAVAKSSTHPNKYYLTRDSRLKNIAMAMVDHQIILELAKRIQCPHLFIKATESKIYEKQNYYDETLDVLKKSNPDFKMIHVNGSHHLHLNTPERVSGIINDFLEKYKIRDRLGNSNVSPVSNKLNTTYKNKIL